MCVCSDSIGIESTELDDCRFLVYVIVTDI